MTWQEKTFEELQIGDVLTSCGGVTWRVIGLSYPGVKADRHIKVAVKDSRTGDIKWFEKSRDYWRFLVEKET